MSTTPHQRDPWQRWDVLTSPMTEAEARQVASYIEMQLEGVSAVVEPPGRSLRLVWEREGVEMIVAALTAHRDSGAEVPQGIIDNCHHWLDHVADDANGP
jgi:hypothetical protein